MKIYILLGDFVGGSTSRVQTTNVAVWTKEEAEKFVVAAPIGYLRSYQEIDLLDSSKDAVDFLKRKYHV